MNNQKKVDEVGWRNFHRKKNGGSAFWEKKPCKKEQRLKKKKAFGILKESPPQKMEDQAGKASWNPSLGVLACHATVVGIYYPGQCRATEDFWAEEQNW